MKRSLSFFYIFENNQKKLLHSGHYSVYITEHQRMSDKTLTTVFTRLRRKFLHTAMQILPNEEDAADALQDAFCRLWPRRDTINDEAKAEALTSITVHNICIDKVRKRRIETVPLNEEHDTEPDNDRTTAEEREQRYNEVKSLIDKELTPQQKRIIELKDIEGVEIEEIARQLLMTESAVRMSLSRARKKIREQYRKEKGYE